MTVSGSGQWQWSVSTDADAKITGGVLHALLAHLCEYANKIAHYAFSYNVLVLQINSTFSNLQHRFNFIDAVCIPWTPQPESLRVSHLIPRIHKYILTTQTAKIWDADP